MAAYPALNIKPYIEPIRLKERAEVDPIKLNIKSFNDLVDLDSKLTSIISETSKAVEEYADKQRKRYELFVLSELYNRGYDLSTLENSNCWRNIQPISTDCERERFYVDDVLVLTIKRTTRFEDIDHKYMIYTDYEAE